MSKLASWSFAATFCLLLMLSIGFIGCGGGGSSLSAGGGGTSTPPPVNFAQPVTISSGGANPGSAVTADFNGDGKLDIAVSNSDSNTIAVFLNQGGGTFAAPVISTFPILNGVGLLALGDVNEDGKPDLIASTTGVTLVLLGIGDGSFSQSPIIPNSSGFLHARIADLNGDKHLDYVGCSNGNMQVALGNGDGSFQAAAFLPNGPFPNTYFGCDIGYFNGDKKLDILGADFLNDTSNLVLFSGNGDGTFNAPTMISSGNSSPDSVSTADFNGDGKLDALVGFAGGSPSLLLGNGDGSFGMPSGVLSVNGVDGVTVLAADLNGDGKPDALAIDYTNGILAIAITPGIPQQSKSSTFNLVPGLRDLAVGDLNGDGLPDIIVVNGQTNQVTIFLSQK